MSRAVDLGQIGHEQVGPKERHAFENELKMMSQTRELALRAQVHLESEKHGYEQLIAYLVYEHGTLSEDETYAVMYVPADRMAEVKEKVRGLELEPGAEMLRLQVQISDPEPEHEGPPEEVNIVVRRGSSREAMQTALEHAVKGALDALWPEPEETPACPA